MIKLTMILVVLTNKHIKMSTFKSSESIQKKEGGPDRSVFSLLEEDQSHKMCQMFEVNISSYCPKTFETNCIYPNQTAP